LLALFAATTWFAWLGWDHTYYEVDGAAQGPYRAWQVIGCALSIATATVLAYRRSPRALAIGVLPIAADAGFAVPWACNASGDESGLWVVGLFLLVIGGYAALTFVLAVTHTLYKPESSPTPALVVCSVSTLLALLVYAPMAIVPLVCGGWLFYFRCLPGRRGSNNGQAHQAKLS
jgi:hypothetical protein